MNKELMNLMLPYCTIENFYKMALYLTVLAGEGLIVCDKDLCELIYIDIFGKEPDDSKLWDLLEEETSK